MKKGEKRALTRERILKAAMIEFGTKGYQAASINCICNTGISKGLIYHNFKSRDELYLCCVSKVYKEFMEYLNQQDIGGDLSKYMNKRLLFFEKNPNQTRIFFETILQPQVGLKANIEEIRKEMDAFNEEIFIRSLEKISLRSHITQEQAVEYFHFLKMVFHGYFYNSLQQDVTSYDFVEQHESQLTKLLDFMIYGIAEREL